MSFPTLYGNMVGGYGVFSTVTVQGGIVTTGTISSSSPIYPGYGGFVGPAALYGGSGVPTLIAPNGSLFLSYTNGLYINESGSGTSGTTWVSAMTGGSGVSSLSTSGAIFTTLTGAKGDVTLAAPYAVDTINAQTIGNLKTFSTGIAITGSSSLTSEYPLYPGNGGTVGSAALYSGSGVPAFSAPQGSVFLSSNGNAYINAAGTSTWTQFGTSTSGVTSISTSGAIFTTLSGATGAVTIAAPNAVDTSSSQTIGGTKTFSNAISAAGVTVTGPITPGLGGSTGSASIYGGSNVPSFSANQGSLFLSSNGSAYVNTSSGSGTTWTLLQSGSGAVTGVTATAPLASSGGAAPVISISSSPTFSGTVTAAQFSGPIVGSGAGLTSGTVPNAALAVTPIDTSSNGQIKSGTFTAGGLTSTNGLTIDGIANITGVLGVASSASITGALTVAGLATFQSGVVSNAVATSTGGTMLVTDGTNTIIRPTASGGSVDFENAAATATVASLSSTGAFAAAKLSASSPGGVNLQFINAADYGVVCDSATDDAPALQNAINAAAALTKAIVYVPRGVNGTCELGSAITMAPNVGFLAPFINFQPHGSYTGNAFVFPSGAYQNGVRYQFSNIQNFTTGCGITLETTGTANMYDAYIEVDTIQYCAYGINLTANSGANAAILQCTVKFRSIINVATAGTGILVYCAANQGIQGCLIQGEFITCQYGIYVGAPSAAANPALSANIFDINVINGNASGTYGIVFVSVSPTGANLFRVASSFGSFGAGQLLNALSGAAPQYQNYELAAGTPGGTSYADWGALYGSGNVLRLLGGSSGSPGGPIMPAGSSYTATTSANTRSSFNSGNAIPYQRFVLLCTLPSNLSAGSYQDFYCYSPFTTGTPSDVTVTANKIEGPLALVYAIDNAAVNANEIWIRLYAFAAASSGTACYVNVIVGGF